ncbi:MAG: dienelactone hydrolase family protein, partial [Candidatus Xenobia bacterium]
TLLMDLLTPQEEAIDLHTRALRFDIDLLAARLSASIDDVTHRPETCRLGIGLFGASTGAAATLMAAVARPENVRAVVSRGGRPDLAGRALGFVDAPTLLIVGSLDSQVLQLNREALAQLKGDKKLEIVADATHLFEEPGALDEVSRLAVQWFEKYLLRAGHELPLSCCR